MTRTSRVPIDPERLREALAPERPDAAAFLEGVRARVAECEVAGGPSLDGSRTLEGPARSVGAATAGDSAARAIPDRWRWAAAILPPGILPVVTAGTAKFGWKSLPAIVALPGIAMVMVLLSFVGGLRRLRDLDADARPSRRTEEGAVRRKWWQEHKKQGVVGIALLVLLFVFGSASVALFGVFASMIVMVVVVGRFARAGMANRLAVTRLCLSVLYVNAMCWWMTHELLPTPLTGPRGMEIAFVILLGMLVCAWCGGRLSAARVRQWMLYPIRMRHPDRITVACLRCLSFPAAALAGVGLVGAVVYLPTTLLRPAWTWSGEDRAERVRELAEWIETRDRDDWLGEKVAVHVAERVADWSPEHAQSMRAAGPAPDRARLMFSLPWKSAAWAAVRVGWLSEDEIIEEYRQESSRVLLHEDGPLVPSLPRILVSRELVRTGGVDAETVDGWVERIEAAWGPDGFGALEDDASIVGWLDAIGRGDVVDAHADELRRRLTAHWLDGSRSGSAYFSTAPVETAWWGRFEPTTIYDWDVETTRAAIALLQRVGVPDGVDVTRMRGSFPGTYLSWKGRWLGEYDSGDVLRILTRLELDAAFPTTPRPLWTWVWDLRQFLAIVLLVALSVYAIRRAPVAVVDSRSARRGRKSAA